MAAQGQKRKEAAELAEAMPKAGSAPSKEHAVARAADSREFAQALALLDWLGPEAVFEREGSLQGMLARCSGWARWFPSNPGEGLAWAERLIALGADPFAGHGEGRSQPSFFEALLDGGLWSYAAKLARGREGQAKEAMLRINETGPHSRPSAKLQAMLMEGGAQALRMAFAAGIDPSGPGPAFGPWVFACQDPQSLSAFAEAGADLWAVDAMGSTLDEAFSRIQGAKARQEMLAALRAAREARPAPAAKEDPSKALLALAARAGFKELSKQAKACGADLMALRGADGRGALAAALEAANWDLGFDLMEAGLDPAEKLPEGLPCGALALWGRGVAAAPRLSEAKRAKEGKCLDRALRAVWAAAPSGAGLLEACSESRKGQRFAYQAMLAWFGIEPEDPSRPLWERLEAMGQGSWMAQQCAKRRGEPWIAPSGRALMAAIVSGDMPGREATGEQISSKGGDLESFAQSVSYGADGRRRLGELFAAPQWEAGMRELRALWGPGGGRVGARVAQERLAAGLRFWCARCDAWGQEPFDFARLSAAMMPGDPSAEWAAGSAEREWVEANVDFLCRRYPRKAGGMFLDLLSRDAAAAARIWREAKSFGRIPQLPEGHRMLAQAGAVGSKLASLPLWREIEEHLIKEASKPPSPTRRL